MRGFKKYSFLILFMMGSFPGFSQRMNIGLNLSLPLFHITHFEENYFSPPQTIRIFMLNHPDAASEKYTYFTPSWGKTHSYTGFGLGAMIRTDHKRFSLRVGAQYQFAHSVMKFFLFKSEGDIDENKARFMTKTFSYNFPLLLSVDLKRTNNSPFIILGGTTGFHTFAQERINWTSAYNGGTFNFMYGIHYNNKSWTNLCIGYGKKFIDGAMGSEFYFLYRHRVDNNKDEFTINFSFIEFNATFYLNNQFLKRKHPIFRGDE
jgi:hypothetical protein